MTTATLRQLAADLAAGNMVRREDGVADQPAPHTHRAQRSDETDADYYGCKPCPHCGGPPLLFAWAGNVDVSCKSCHCRTGKYSWTDAGKLAAVNAWNKRLDAIAAGAHEVQP
jgi:hypothetical protein